MSSSSRRIAAFAIGSALGFGAATVPAPAALDLFVGAQRLVKGEGVSGCNSKAKAALDSVLTNASEIGSGDTGEWKAYSPADASGNSFAAAAIHCYPVSDTSYLVTFTCAAQVPPSQDTANAICDKVTSAFGGGH